MNLFKGHDDKKSDGGSNKKPDAAGADAAGSDAGGSDAGGDDGNKVGNMPEGDYIIHILII